MLRLSASIVLALAACSSSHARPTSYDSGSPGSDAGTARDAPPPLVACADGLVAERARCVGWRLAASLPFDVGLAGDPARPPAPELVRIASSGEIVIRGGGVLLRYLPVDDRFEEVAATAVVPVEVPSNALPDVPYNEYGRVLGWLDDGMRVITHVRYYAVTWVAERDDRGDGVWRPTAQPDFVFQPAVAYPIDERSILFAGRSSSVYVAYP